jgi:imidazolonepropionase-like amidohydrolase
MGSASAEDRNNMQKNLTALAIIAALATSATADEVVVKAAKVYTQTGAPLAPGAVRIKDGKIAEVAAQIATPAGVKLIDLGAGVLIPGLIDAHTSLGIDGGTAEQTMEVTPTFRVLDGIDWSARAFREARSEGTTTVGLVPGTDNVFAGLSSIVKTAGDRKQRVVKADHALVITAASDPAAGNSARARPDSIYARQPTNRMGVIWILRSEFGRAKAATAAQTEPIREALAAKRPVICVSRVDNDILSALRLKQDYPMALTIAGGQESYKVRDALATAKVPVLLGRQSTTAGIGAELSETIFNTAGLLHEFGVPFALTGGQLLDQARFAVRHGLPADMALASITAAPAKILGVQNRVGTIAAGLDADLVALSGDPFDLTTAVRWTMCNGVLYPEDK